MRLLSGHAIAHELAVVLRAQDTRARHRGQDQFPGEQLGVFGLGEELLWSLREDTSLGDLRRSGARTGPVLMPVDQAGLHRIGNGVHNLIHHVSALGEHAVVVGKSLDAYSGASWTPIPAHRGQQEWNIPLIEPVTGQKHRAYLRGSVFFPAAFSAAGTCETFTFNSVSSACTISSLSLPFGSGCSSSVARPWWRSYMRCRFPWVAATGRIGPNRQCTTPASYRKRTPFMNFVRNKSETCHLTSDDVTGTRRFQQDVTKT